MGSSFITDCVLDVRTRSVCYKNYRFDTSLSLRLVSFVVAVCSSTAEAIVLGMSLI